MILCEYVYLSDQISGDLMHVAPYVRKNNFRLLLISFVRCYGHKIACEKTLFSGERTNNNLIFEYFFDQSLADLIENNIRGLSENDLKY